MPTNMISMQQPTDYTSGNMETQRRMAMAQALQQQALAPIEQTTAGGRVVPISPWQGIARLAQAFASRKIQDSAEESANKSAQTYQERLAQTLQAFGQEQDPQKRAAIMLTHPETRPVGMKMLEQLSTSGKYGNTPHYDQNGRAFVLNERGEPKFLDGVAARDKMENVNGVWQNPYAQSPNAIAPQDPNKPFSVGPTGPLANKGYQDYELKKAKVGASNVSVNTAQKPMLTEIGKGVGEAVMSGFNQAQQANQTLGNVQQIRSGLDKVIAGPGANARITLAQIGETLGVNGKDTTEKLQNTRNVIQGLARQELAAAGQMKGQGQITENERKLLQKAESGQVNELTKPELTTLLTAMEKTANYRLGVHSQNLERLKSDPNAAPMVQYLTLPGGGQAPAPQQNKQVTVDW